MRLCVEDELRVRPKTAHRDYVLTDYVPFAPPAGRLQPASFFRHCLRAEGWLDTVWPVCARLQEALGSDQTVWAMKYGAAGPGVELYFYNNRANQPTGPHSVLPIAAALSDFGAFDRLPDERIPYFMWSFELDPAALARRSLGTVRLYLATGETARTPGGFSHRLDADATVLENHYAFYRPPTELAEVFRRLSHSPRSGRPSVHRSLVPAWLTDAHTICYAVKPTRDGLYFARLRSAQLARYLREVHKSDLAAVLEAHAQDFAHCAWDLGFDFDLPPEASRAAVAKLAVHGIF